MKIKSIEIDTDLGRRVVQISPPIDVDPTGPMPTHFGSLIELLWDVTQKVASNAPKFSAPKAEA